MNFFTANFLLYLHSRLFFVSSALMPRRLSFPEMSPYMILTVVLDRMLFFGADDYAIGYVRGALVQKVADRYHVALLGNAANILALGDLAGGWKAATKSLLGQLASPWTYLKEKFDFLSLGEEAGRTFAIGFLLDRYLSRERKTEVKEPEAVRLRSLMDEALKKTTLRLPPEVLAAIRRAGGEVASDFMGTVGAGVSRQTQRRRKGGRQASAMDQLLSRVNTAVQQTSAEIAGVLARQASLFAQQLERSFDQSSLGSRVGLHAKRRPLSAAQ